MPALAAAALVAAAGVAGCGGGSTGAAPSSGASSAAPAVTSASASASASPATSSAAPSTSAAPTTATSTSPTGAGATGSTASACSGSALTGKVASTNGGAGHEQVIITLTNRSSATCTMDGYPTLHLLGAGAQPLPTTVVHGGAMSFPNRAPTAVPLAPGAVASFDLEYSDVPTGSASSCTQASSLAVTPPGGTGAAHVTLRAVACGHGTLHVSPVVTGSAGA